MPEQLLLPLRPKPLSDELCSSWLLRLASSSGITLHDLRRLISPRIRLPNYDCDLAFGIRQLEEIANATATDLETLRCTLLRFEYDAGQGIGWLEAWLLPVGSDEYTKERLGYQYCPICLGTGIPYFRKLWRFSIINSCIQHRCQLIDRCRRCGLPIHGFAIGLLGLEKSWLRDGEPPFLRCTGCGWDLRGAPPETVENDVLAIQGRHEELLRQTPAGNFNATDYFWLLKNSANLFAKDLGTVPFEYLTVRYRSQVLERADWLLQGGRWRYISSVCSTARADMSRPQRKPAGLAALADKPDQTARTS